MTDSKKVIKYLFNRKAKSREPFCENEKRSVSFCNEI